MVINCEHRFSLDERAFWIPNNIKCDITEKKNMWILWSMMMVALIRQLSSLDTGIDRLFTNCKGGNFNIHIWAWFGYFIC